LGHEWNKNRARHQHDFWWSADRLLFLWGRRGLLLGFRARPGLDYLNPDHFGLRPARRLRRASGRALGRCVTHLVVVFILGCHVAARTSSDDLHSSLGVFMALPKVNAAGERG
jgi:hypothetical protein